MSVFIEEEEVTIENLLKSGAHFGHKKQRWNPKMRRFIYEERNGIYIINLAKTIHQIRENVEVVKEVISKKKSVLFVGTKKQAKVVIREFAEKCEEFYVCERWLGGTLTNLPTIRKSVKTLERIEKQIETGSEGLKKKELSQLGKKKGKLDKALSGIRKMRKPPGLLVVVDPSRERIAVSEANKLGIPVMALVDTNCDPDPIDYVIACNDDALKSIRLVLGALCKAILEKKEELNLARTKAALAKEEKEAEEREERLDGGEGESS